MNKIYSLTKVLLKNSWSTFSTGKGQRKKNVLYLLLIGFAILPMVVGIGTSTATMYDLLVQIHQEGILLATGFTFVSVLILVFGIFYVINVFYFAQDIDILLPLPLKPLQILSAKFCVTLIYEYLTVAMFLLPLIIAFGIKSSAGIIFYFYSLLLMLTVPVIPLIIASVIVIITMRFSNLTKKKDQFRIAAAIMGIFFIIAINYVTSNYMSATGHPEKALNLITEGNNVFINTVSKVFPTAKIATSCLMNYSGLSGLTELLSFYFINALFVVVFLTLGEELYFKGAVGVSEVYTNRKILSSVDLHKTLSKNSLFKSYAMKEIKVLLRTPAYFINCVLTNFLWPIILGVAFLSADGDLKNIYRFLMQSNMESIIIAGTFALSLFITASNSIAASAISREGNGFFVNKYIPVSYRTVIISKLFVSALVGFVAFLMLLIAASLLLNISVPVFIISLILSLPGVVLATEIGLLLDINYPKLIWDNEYKPIKQNLNVVINIFLNALIGAAIIYIEVKFKLDYEQEFFIIFVFFTIINLLLYKVLISKGVESIRLLEIK